MTKGSLVHRLAVKSMLHQHQEGCYADDEAQDALLKKKKQDELRELSLKYQIASPWTSFVAVEERKEGENVRKEVTYSSELLRLQFLYAQVLSCVAHSCNSRPH